MKGERRKEKRDRKRKETEREEREKEKMEIENESVNQSGEKKGKPPMYCAGFLFSFFFLLSTQTAPSLSFLSPPIFSLSSSLFFSLFLSFQKNRNCHISSGGHFIDSLSLSSFWA